MNSETVKHFLKSIEVAPITPQSFQEDILDDKCEFKRKHLGCVNSVDYFQYGDKVVAIRGDYGAITRLKSMPPFMTEDAMIIASCRPSL